ncbi:MAG: hypothetical protein ACRERU_07450 [Methylococcales bacterium]
MTNFRLRLAFLAAWAVNPIIMGLVLFPYQLISPDRLWYGNAEYWSLLNDTDMFSTVGADQFRSSFSQPTECGQLDQGLSSVMSVQGSHRREMPALWIEVSDRKLVTRFVALRSSYFGPDTGDLLSAWYFSASDEEINQPLISIAGGSCRRFDLRVLPGNPEYTAHSLITAFKIRPE